MVVLREMKEGAQKEGLEAFHEENLGRKRQELIWEEIRSHQLDC